MRSILLAITVVACSAQAAPRTAEPAPALVLTPEQQKRAAALDAAVVRALAGKPYAGLSVAVVIDGVPILARGYGMADVAARRPAAADTVYRIGSITKTFTAAAVMKLVADGKLGLDEPITKYLPDYDTHGATITVRQLLTHTSGVKGYTEIAAFWPRSHQAFPRAELVAMFEAEALQFPPGERWSYSNSGYYLLGLIIEKVAGAGYADVVRDRLATPAGLRATTYCPDAMTEPTQARPYVIDKGKPVAAPPIEMDHPYAAGSLCSTVTDLARWMAALAGHTVVTAEQWRQMTTPVPLADGTTFPYGYGMMVGDLDGHPKYGHNGGINGFHTKLEIFPADGVVIAVMANTGGGLVDGVAEELARTALDLPAPTILDLPLSEPEATVYLGRYKFTEVPVSLEFRYQDGKLHAANLNEDGTPGRFLPLRHQGNHVFAAPEVRARMTFTVDNGRATGLTVEQGGMTLRGAPMP